MIWGLYYNIHGNSEITTTNLPAMKQIYIYIDGILLELLMAINLCFFEKKCTFLVSVCDL